MIQIHTHIYYSFFKYSFPRQFIIEYWIQFPVLYSCCLVAKSCLILCHPMDCVASSAPLSTGFSWQGYWSGLPCLLFLDCHLFRSQSVAYFGPGTPICIVGVLRAQHLTDHSNNSSCCSYSWSGQSPTHERHLGWESVQGWIGEYISSGFLYLQARWVQVVRAWS